MVRAIKNFLWYKPEDQIKEEDMKYIPEWEKLGYVSSDKVEIKKEKEEVIDVKGLDEESKERVEDIVEDLKDDGKRNFSNKKKKSSKK